MILGMLLLGSSCRLIVATVVFVRCRGDAFVGVAVAVLIVGGLTPSTLNPTPPPKKKKKP